jgi:hypothetical protein
LIGAEGVNRQVLLLYGSYRRSHQFRSHRKISPGSKLGRIDRRDQHVFVDFCRAGRDLVGSVAAKSLRWCERITGGSEFGCSPDLFFLVKGKGNGCARRVVSIIWRNRGTDLTASNARYSFRLHNFIALGSYGSPVQIRRGPATVMATKAATKSL